MVCVHFVLCRRVSVCKIDTVWVCFSERETSKVYIVNCVFCYTLQQYVVVAPHEPSESMRTTYVCVFSRNCTQHSRASQNTDRHTHKHTSAFAAVHKTLPNTHRFNDTTTLDCLCTQRDASQPIFLSSSTSTAAAATLPTIMCTLCTSHIWPENKTHTHMHTNTNTNANANDDDDNGGRRKSKNGTNGPRRENRRQHDRTSTRELKTD